MNNSALKAIGSIAVSQHSRGTAYLLILMLVLFISFGAGQVRAQCGSLSAPSTLWQNGGNSFWNIDGNWTSGTPTASTNACILNGVSTVTLNTAGNANGLQLASGNTLNINSGSLSLASGKSLNFGALLINFGSVTNSGALTNNGSIDLTEGGLTNNSGASLTNNGSISGAVFVNLINSGAFINNGQLVVNVDSGVVNNASASFVNTGTINGDASGIINSGIFNNSGTISFTSFFDPSNMANSGVFNNTGTISIIGSPSFPEGGAFSNSGTFNNSGTLSFSGDLSGQTGVLPSFNAGTFNNNGTMNGGSLGCLFCSFSNSGTFNNSGTMNIALNAFGNSGILNNSGTLNNLGTLSNSGAISNSGTFTNAGAVTISNSGLFTTSTNYTQIAGSTLVNGMLTATGGAIVDIQGGALSGTGTINGDVLMKGIMSPGSGGAPGTFTIIGNYEQAGTGVFDELISGANSNGVLDVTGVLALDPGSLLEITLQGGFNPLGDSFTILNYGSLLGEFSNAPIFFADGFEWTVTYGSNDAVLTAVSAPEPSTMPLIAIGLLALVWFARKRAAAL